MKNILVTGGKGQLGLCLKELSTNYKDFNFVFVDIENLDITNRGDISNFFRKNKFDFCINCAAYTAVDRAEDERERANLINNIGVGYLADACAKNSAILIHISTDFVFDGNNNLPYTELDITNPISEYGISKLKGEEAALLTCPNSFIIRTSWLYSEYGSNFVKTMLKLAESKEKLSIISDQIGSPTYAKDLASIILKLILSKNLKYGLYHYSNEGVASWYDFAKAIFDIERIIINVEPIPTSSYPTPAMRPHNSTLDKSKLKSTLDISIPYWRDSLKICLKEIIKNE